jgi:hypothetical protein
MMAVLLFEKCINELLLVKQHKDILVNKWNYIQYPFQIPAK